MASFATEKGPSEDQVGLLDNEDSQGDQLESEEVKVAEKYPRMPVVRKNPTTSATGHGGLRRHHPADLPYSVTENSASESFRMPKQRSFHYPERPRRQKCFKKVRWILGITMIVAMVCLAGAGVYLLLSSTAVVGRPWYTKALIYQCYPQSFQDSNGDGVGDLNGIRQRVDYFTEIGVQAVWLNPIFDSPHKDNGYDISNYTAIDKQYGTLADFKLLLNELHGNSLRLLLDFVPNHTSDQHPWFKSSRSNKTNSKRDWYVWADGQVGGSPPNNWISVFGGSAWTYDNSTSQWYLHQFSSFQPDLNYSNPDVRKEMIKILEFWLDMGVDGFRVDAVQFLLEDPQLRNESLSPGFNDSTCAKNNSDPECYHSLIHNYTTNYPGIHDITKEWKVIIDKYSTSSQKLFIGEIYNDIDTVIEYYGTNGNEFTFPFNFFLLDNTNWTGNSVACIIDKWMRNMPLGGTANWVLGNHDNSRIASKAGVYLARALNVLLLTLPGAATTYYGEEILMTDVYIPPDKQKDKYEHRDAERTPMQWNITLNAGFTNGTPWLPLATNYSSVNVEVQSSSANKTSMLHLYQQLSALKNSKQPFTTGNYTCVNATKELIVYIRHATEDESYKEIIVVAINFSQRNITTAIDLGLSDTDILLSSYLDKTGKIDLKSPLTLRNGEGLVVMGTRTDKSKVNDYINNDKCRLCT